MTSNPIRKVLSTLRCEDVRALLMGGQACVLYGAAEVSHDHPDAASERAAVRPLLRAAMAGDRATLERQLREEEAAERERDRIYWEPLRRELEVLRRSP